MGKQVIIFSTISQYQTHLETPKTKDFFSHHNLLFLCKQEVQADKINPHLNSTNIIFNKNNISIVKSKNMKICISDDKGMHFVSKPD